ncbi:hypothetical protein GQ44DRAFT_617977 [Phaeosphaeriaceae sp. PMI808]|nr:hypothetical protein GQ44DRAFT_617977 [Phaeosphaeriaceae sp. PMI808]
MRQTYGGPKLPKELRDQFGDPANRGQKSGGRNGQLNRKDKRKAERTEKKSQKGNRALPVRPSPVSSRYERKPVRDERESEEEEIDWDNVTDEGTPPPPPVKESPKPRKSILKKTSLPKEASPPPPAATVSRVVKDRLAQEDAEIRALEKKLGVKSKKKSKGADDGLADIFGDLGDFGSSEDELEGKPVKRKRDEDDAWLASKRRKALGTALEESSEDDADLEELGSDDLDDGQEEIGLSGEDDESALEDYDSDEEGSNGGVEPVQPRKRENPYVAPISSDFAQPTKYIPPALRAPPSSDAEALSRLKRQIQGLLNRLSEANILSILRDIEQVYQNNPRGYVNTTLADLLMGMLSDPSALLDTFLILHAGFIAAVYKVIGPDFGAQIVERIVAEFDQHYQRNKEGTGKQTTNLVSLLADLYTFQVIGSNLIFDYIRFFLDELSDINTELLLRIVRAAGPQLRQDDPSALKDIVVLLQKSVAKIDSKNLSVRTKFMIETINDLKNNRMKTGVAASAISREHTTRMKKELGTLSARNLKATEPLRIGLMDINDTEKRGKWWMVGASWRNDVVSEATVAKSTDLQPKQASQLDDEDASDDVDLVQLAREQRMNTDVRRAIFISIMSASDFKDAYVRLNKLNLKKSQETEVPRVIVHCAGTETSYNPYYTVLARKVCADHKTRKSFQFALWDIFKSLGERQDGVEESDEEEDASMNDSQSLRKLVNQGKLYGTLIGRKALPITSLKNLNFPYLQSKTKTFIEVLLVSTILESQKGLKDKRNNKALLEVFVEVDQAPEMIAGLQYCLKKVVAKTVIVEKGEKETVTWGCKAVMDMLARLLATTTMEED